MVPWYCSFCATAAHGRCTARRPHAAGTLRTLGSNNDIMSTERREVCCGTHRPQVERILEETPQWAGRGAALHAVSVLAMLVAQ